MLSFLKESRKFLNAKDAVCVIIGNESCDLDSAVSALSLAHFYAERQNQEAAAGISKHCQPVQYLPVLNIPRCDYPLKTEVKCLLNKYAIPEDILIFKDDLSDNLLESSEFILVDHHVSPYSSRCIEVFDHRILDAHAQLPLNCKKHIDLVGSCATLIGALIVEYLKGDCNCNCFSCTICLLRATIILDTVNFSAPAKRATPKDHDVCNALERLLPPSSCVEEREELFDTLQRARADIGMLTPYQLLKKDLKIISDTNNHIRIALPGFPILVEQFIQEENASNAVLQLAAETKCAIVLLIGMHVHKSNNIVERDIGLICINTTPLFNGIMQALLSSTKPNFGFERNVECQFLGGHFFKQHNVTVTRKHILPIAKGILEKPE